jgi:hypothetical protein
MIPKRATIIRNNPVLRNQVPVEKDKRLAKIKVQSPNQPTQTIRPHPAAVNQAKAQTNLNRITSRVPAKTAPAGVRRAINPTRRTREMAKVNAMMD